jgi:hypothetical protein
MLGIRQVQRLVPDTSVVTLKIGADTKRFPYNGFGVIPWGARERWRLPWRIRLADLGHLDDWRVKASRCAIVMNEDLYRARRSQARRLRIEQRRSATCSRRRLRRNILIVTLLSLAIGGFCANQEWPQRTAENIQNYASAMGDELARRSSDETLRAAVARRSPRAE